MSDFRSAVRGRLIVSCQEPAGHPMRDTGTLARVARAVAAGGAAAIRCGGTGGVADVAAIRAAVTVPVIGLTKDGDRGVYITPTVRSALDVVAAGADVVATDATGRKRPDGRTFADTVTAVHRAGRLVLADIAGLADAVAAFSAGADMIATTLSGYLSDSVPAAGPDLSLIADIRTELPDAFLIAEGRYHTPAQARAAIEAGADSVVVGTAITDPGWITGTFVSAVHS